MFRKLLQRLLAFLLNLYYPAYCTCCKKKLPMKFFWAVESCKGCYTNERMSIEGVIWAPLYAADDHEGTQGDGGRVR